MTFSQSGLKSIVIPPSISFIDGSAFVQSSLSSISISPDNQRFRVRDSFLEDVNGSTIYRYFGASASVVIRSSVRVIGKSSFHGCKFLKSVFFDGRSQLRRIEESAFRETGLKSIQIPSSVTSLGNESFSGCGELESLGFETGSQLERIEEFAFHGCPLGPTVIPLSVISLGKQSLPVASCREQGPSIGLSGRAGLCNTNAT
jgi:hypothetical protein